MSDLFDAKTINRLCGGVLFTDDQKTATRKWLKYLEGDELKSETQNYIRFEKIIMNDILDYPIDDIVANTDNMEF